MKTIYDQFADEISEAEDRELLERLNLLKKYVGYRDNVEVLSTFIKPVPSKFQMVWHPANQETNSIGSKVGQLKARVSVKECDLSLINVNPVPSKLALLVCRPTTYQKSAMRWLLKLERSRANIPTGAGKAKDCRRIVKVGLMYTAASLVNPPRSLKFRTRRAAKKFFGQNPTVVRSSRQMESFFGKPS